MYTFYEIIFLFPNSSGIKTRTDIRCFEVSLRDSRDVLVPYIRLFIYKKDFFLFRLCVTIQFALTALSVVDLSPAVAYCTQLRSIP